MVLAHALLVSSLAFAPNHRSLVGRSPSTVRRGCSCLARTLVDLSGRYDTFLLDQFGVIHDGSKAYEGAVEAVSALQRLGKQIIIISNSSRRRSDTAARLQRMGFAFDATDVVTSGDLVFAGLSAGTDAVFKDLGPRCFVFGNGDDDEEYVRACGKVTAPTEEADFILARGLFSVLGAGPAAPYSAEAEAKALAASLSRVEGGIPMLVANPDETRPDGADSPMPGQLARRYEQQGAADVRRVGKPHPLIYEACRAQMAGHGTGQRIVAVGDSLHHDVLGAARNGIDAVFCCAGVHADELGVPQARGDVEPEPERLRALLDRFADETGGCAPTHVLAGFRM